MNERLKQARLDKGLKIKDVADILNTTSRSIARYEDGTREPSIELLAKFCKLYGVSADFLIGIADY